MIKDKMRLNLILVMLLFAGCKTKVNTIKSSTQIEIQKTLDELVATNEVPGLNFSYIDADGKQFDFSSGKENTTTQTKLEPSHLMFSGSIGKTYAAAMIFQLVDEGKVELEDKILKHLPSEAWLKRISNIDKITIEMLLSHTTGLPRWVMKSEVWEELHTTPDKVWTYKDRLGYIFDEPEVHAPGDGWAYSDTNYILLGWLIESVLTQNYYAALRSRILKPYGLKETLAADKRKIVKLAMGYSSLPESFKIPKEVVTTEGEFIFNPQMEWTGGGITSTTADLAKWGHLYFTGDVFSNTLRNKMITISESGKNVMGDHSYGMGSFVYSTMQGKAYGHPGFMPGYNSIVAYYPESDLTLALQVNCDYASKKMKMTEYLDQIMESLLEIKKG